MIRIAHVGFNTPQHSIAILQLDLIRLDPLDNFYIRRVGDIFTLEGT